MYDSYENPSMLDKYWARMDAGEGIMTNRETVMFAIRNYIGPDLKIITPNDELDFISSLRGNAQRHRFLCAALRQLEYYNIKPDTQKYIKQEIEKLYYLDNSSGIYTGSSNLEKYYPIDYVWTSKKKLMEEKISEFKQKLSVNAAAIPKIKKDAKKTLKEAKLKQMVNDGTIQLSPEEIEKINAVNAKIAANAKYANPGVNKKLNPLVEALKVKQIDFAALPAYGKAKSLGAKTGTKTGTQVDVTETVTRTTVTIQTVPEVTGRKFKK